MSEKHGEVQALIGQHVKRDVPYIHCLNHKLLFSGCSCAQLFTCCLRVL